MVRDDRQRRKTLRVSGACLALGVLGCAGLVFTKPTSPRRNVFARNLEVTVAAAEFKTETTPVVGHGTVRAKNQVKIVPQVNGALMHVHPDLAVGMTIPEGELLFEIEPGMYEARVRQSQAEVKRLEAALIRHDEELSNLELRIANADQMLAIEEADYMTSKRLLEQEKVGTERDVDLIHQNYLQRKDATIELKSRRSLIPHVKLETQALLEAARARLSQDQLNLKHTKIYCPFDARVELVSAYRSQVVTAHFSVATLTDMSAFELSVGVDPRDLRWLDESIRPEALNEEQEGPRPEVRVKWALHGQELSWRGYVTRFERVDEATRTARLVVEIRDVDMIAKVQRGGADDSPTLAIGMHCRAELPARKLTDALLIPRHAVYDNRWVYVFEPDGDASSSAVGRLARRQVSLLRSIGDSVLVDYSGFNDDERDSGACELEAGELIVVSPLIKPVIGMSIHRDDDKLALLPVADDVSARRSSRWVPEQPMVVVGHGSNESHSPLLSQASLARGAE